MMGGFLGVASAADADRADLFTRSGARSDRRTRPENIEKDFWVCATLDVLFNDRPAGAKRLLFKGGTSLSKAFGLISRFSEDIDVTVFRDDLGHRIDAAGMEALSRGKRTAELDAIRDDCSKYIRTTFKDEITGGLAAAMAQAGVSEGRWRVENDSDDPDGQSLLFWYPTAFKVDDGYVRRTVKIESGAKSALDPHLTARVAPYAATEAPHLEMTVNNVVTVDPTRTFWDKIIIAHGQHQWVKNRSELKGGGQRLTRHYYDLHRLMASDVGQRALDDTELRDDVVRHARMFFDRRPFGLDLAAEGTFTLTPPKMVMEQLRADYRAMSGMIFGDVPEFDEVMESVRNLESQLVPAVPQP